MPWFPPEFSDPDYRSDRARQDAADLQRQVDKAESRYQEDTRQIERLESEGKTVQAAVVRVCRWWGEPVV